MNLLEDKSHLPVSDEMKKVMEELKALAVELCPITITRPSNAEIARANRECWSDPMWLLLRSNYERNGPYKMLHLKSRKGNDDATEYCFRPPLGVQQDRSEERFEG